MISSKTIAVSIVAAGFFSQPAFSKTVENTTALRQVELKRSPDSVNKYDGLLASKKIVMQLSETSVGYIGGYAYISANQGSSPLQWIDLDGKKSSDGMVVMTEKVANKVTGQFKGKVSGNSFTGVWTSPSGKSFPFSLEAQINVAPTFIADVESSPDSRHVKKINVYSGKKLLQSVPMDVTLDDSDSNIEYQTLDYNFDGYLDFSLSLEDSGKAYLLFDTKSNGFVVAPRSLQKIKVTSIKYSTKELNEEWANGSYVGMNIYKYANGNYCMIEETSVSPSEKTSTKKYPVSQCKTKEK